MMIIVKLGRIFAVCVFCCLVNVQSSFVPSTRKRCVSFVRRTENAGSTCVAAGPATLEPPTIKEKVAEKKKESVTEKSYDEKRGGWAVRLFNDPFNKREFVAMCLSKIVGLTDGQSYQVMMQAHKQGVAVVGRFDLERAELYKTSLIEHGLLSDMIPVEDD